MMNGRLDIKFAMQQLKLRSEFANITLADITKVNYNMNKVASGAYNADFTAFNTRQAINKASDGFPRYCYFGYMYLGQDGGQLGFKYRSLFVINSVEVVYNMINNLVLFDSTDNGAGTANLFWQFNGIMIDRGA